MKESKDHLDIDLEFLDKKEPLRVAPKKPEPPKGNEPNWRIYDPKNANVGKPYSGDRHYNWKNILIVGGIILFFGWIFVASSGDSSSSSSSASNSTYTPTSNSNYDLTTGTGQTFSCSDSNYSRALALRPDPSTVSALSSESDSLDSRTSALKAQHSEIDSMYVDQTDQSSLDSYNSAVDDFNYKNNRLKTDIASWNARNSAMNNQIDTYNSFLDTNCSPR